MFLGKARTSVVGEGGEGGEEEGWGRSDWRRGVGEEEVVGGGWWEKTEDKVRNESRITKHEGTTHSAQASAPKTVSCILWVLLCVLG